MKQPFLHVANGTSTTQLIAAAGIPGARSIWADPLHDGPVPPGLTDDELLEVRARHLGGAAWQADGDPVNDLREWRRALDRHDLYEELVLWFEHDLFDQLNLVQLLTWTRQRIPAWKPVSLICIGSFPGRPGFKGLGELSPADIASLLDTRQLVTERQYALAADAWAAFRAPSPEPLDALRQADTSALPFLGPSVTRFLEEYPWTSDGLSRTERRLLRLASAGTVELVAAFPLMHEGEGAYYVADLSFRDTAMSLARSSPPLLEHSSDPSAGAGALHGTVTLTSAGEDVLNGTADRVRTCGIDRCFGGVHVQGRGPVWRWHEPQQRMIIS